MMEGAGGSGRGAPLKPQIWNYLVIMMSVPHRLSLLYCLLGPAAAAGSLG